MCSSSCGFRLLAPLGALCMVAELWTKQKSCSVQGVTLSETSRSPSFCPRITAVFSRPKPAALDMFLVVPSCLTVSPGQISARPGIIAFVPSWIRLPICDHDLLLGSCWDWRYLSYCRSRGFFSFLAPGFHFGPGYRSPARVSFAELWTEYSPRTAGHSELWTGIVGEPAKCLFPAFRRHPGLRHFLQITAIRSPGVPVSSFSVQIGSSSIVSQQSRFVNTASGFRTWAERVHSRQDGVYITALDVRLPVFPSFSRGP